MSRSQMLRSPQTGSASLSSPTITTTGKRKRKRESSTTETLTLTLVPPPPLDSSSEEILTRLKTRLSQSLADDKSDVGAKRSALVAFAKKINEAHRVLDDLVDDYSGYLNRDDDDASSSGKRLNVSDIISYSRKISYTTFAPPEFGAGRGPLRSLTLPPAPQEEKMRASRLFQASSLIQLQPQVVSHPSGGPQEEQMRASPLSLIQPQPQVVRHPSGDPLPRKPTRVVPYVQLDITQDDDDNDYSYTSTSDSD